MIRSNFIGLLRKDIAPFYEIRFRLNNQEYRQIIEETPDAMTQFRVTAVRFQPGAQVQAIAAEISSAVAALPASDGGKQLVSAWNEVVAAIAKPPAAASGAPDALALDQLQRLKAQIDDSVQRALAKNAELLRLTARCSPITRCSSRAPRETQGRRGCCEQSESLRASKQRTSERGDPGASSASEAPRKQIGDDHACTNARSGSGAVPHTREIGKKAIAFSTSPAVTKEQKQAAGDALDDIDDDFIRAAVEDIHGRTRKFQEFIDFMENVLLELSQVGLFTALNEVQGVLDHSKALLQAANK